MTGAHLTATAAGIIALVAGLVLAYMGDAPRTRILLLIGGSMSVTAGVFGRVSGKAATAVGDVSASATSAIFGSAVGLVGLILLCWLVVRGLWKGGISHWTDTAAVILPPLSASAGGLVLAVCGLIATVDVVVLQQLWSVGGDVVHGFRNWGA